ncbi:jg3299 [Pararge aegeria aegeria]|uniref:Jg3299 protein n=3 Tax=Pararge aegeria TaxID=116150 RepID=A0A8S4RTN1_9NEOP|nr:jg3299 [Pararge aegeria aegeria]
MKITILLCAVATIASAVPTNYHDNLQDQETVLENLPTTIQREKKSPLHDHHATGLTLEGAEDKLTQGTPKSGSRLSPTEGRSFGYQKPIIVKKKIGYHVYRDSDEEMAHADPHENCRKQVKVKLCDEEPGSPKNMVSCFTSERLKEEISEQEIENSIKTAKEAVENLQRGFHKMEHNSAKLVNIEDKELEDDSAVHQHIEAARQALEHVHQNFGNLDTLNLPVTVSKTEDSQLMASSDEDRLAQWKEAIDNIQKNFEIARNIEDAFKSDSEQTNLQSTHKDDSSKIRESEHTESTFNVDSKLKSNTGSDVGLLADESDALQKHSDFDMFTAPSEHKELKIKLHSDSLKSEKITEEPLNDHESETRNTQKSNEHTLTMKSSEFTPTVEESLKTEGVKSDDHQDIRDHAHKQQLKAVNDFNLESESKTHDMEMKTEKTALSEVEDMTPLVIDKSSDDKVNLAKSALHDMSMEASDVSQHQTHSEVKHSLNNEMEKSTHKGDFIEAKTSLTGGQAKSVHNIDEDHRHIESISHGIQEKETNIPHNTHINPLNTMRSADGKFIKLSSTKGFNNEHESINTHSLMKLTEDQNMEHKVNEMHRNDHLGMRMTEDQNSFFMRWADENQQRAQGSPLSITEDLTTPTKIGELNNGQHFHNEHTGMRLSQDHNTGHQLTEDHEHPLSMQWAQEKQQNSLTQIQNLLKANAKTAFPETMRLNQHQNMQNKVTDNNNLRDLFSMRLAQEKHQHDHLKSLSEFHDGHIHEASQNGFAHNLVNTHDLSQLGPRMHEHLHIMKHAMASDMDSAMQPSMHMNMRGAMGKPAFEHNDMPWNHHHHATARYGSGLPMTGASPGAVGLFPNANTGGCGIPLMLSCSPSVVPGTLAKTQAHPGTITAPAYRSEDDLVYYMKRDAKDTEELPTIKVQKSSIPFNHKPELIFDKTQ